MFGLLVFVLGAVSADAATLTASDPAAETAATVPKPNPSAEARELYAQGDLHGARQMFAAAASLDPQQGDHWYALGVVLQDLGRDEEARGAYESSLEAAVPPQRLDGALFNLAHLCDEPAEAARHYAEVTRVAPGFPEGFLNLGSVLNDLGRYVDAEGAFRSALELDPRLGKARVGLAYALSKLGLGVEALAEARRGAVLEPRNADALALLAHLSGDEADYRRAFEVSGRPKVLHELAKVVGAVAGREEEARGLYKEAERLAGDAVVPVADLFELRGEVLSESPRVTRLPDVVTADEAEHVIQLATPLLAKSRTAFGAKHGEVRSSSSANLKPFFDRGDPVLRRVVERLGFQAQARDIDLQVVRYQPGEEFREHHDAGPLFPRAVTAFVVLRGPEEGGATAFPRIDVRVPPVDGQAVLWHNFRVEDGVLDERVVHAGEAVVEGEKWGLNVWVGASSSSSSGASV